jgi:protein gp37
VEADIAIFADTHNEPAAVYRHLWALAEQCAAQSFPLMECVGKRAVGRLLDGRIWDEMPQRQMAR